MLLKSRVQGPDAYSVQDSRPLSYGGYDRWSWSWSQTQGLITGIAGHYQNHHTHLSSSIQIGLWRNKILQHTNVPNHLGLLFLTILEFFSFFLLENNGGEAGTEEIWSLFCVPMSTQAAGFQISWRGSLVIWLYLIKINCGSQARKWQRRVMLQKWKKGRFVLLESKDRSWSKTTHRFFYSAIRG